MQHAGSAFGAVQEGSAFGAGQDGSALGAGHDGSAFFLSSSVFAGPFSSFFSFLPSPSSSSESSFAAAIFLASLLALCLAFRSALHCSTASALAFSISPAFFSASSLASLVFFSSSALSASFLTSLAFSSLAFLASSSAFSVYFLRSSVEPQLSPSFPSFLVVDKPLTASFSPARSAARV